jgi:hypothetical protein
MELVIPPEHIAGCSVDVSSESGTRFRESQTDWNEVENNGTHDPLSRYREESGVVLCDMVMVIQPIVARANMSRILAGLSPPYMARVRDWGLESNSSETA